MRSSDKLLLNNKSWAQEIRELRPDYFARMARQQRPEFLWIGCSDSRVPANAITGTEPGEMFVHRNVANLCVPGDLNLLSVLQYAVDVLEVKHVIVCGHYGCGGVKASLGPEPLSGPVDSWLDNLRRVRDLHREEIDRRAEDERANCLCEWSVREQVENLARTDIIQRAWAKRRAPSLHGWVYALSDGVLRELVRRDAAWA